MCAPFVMAGVSIVQGGAQSVVVTYSGRALSRLGPIELVSHNVARIV